MLEDLLCSWSSLSLDETFQMWMYPWESAVAARFMKGCFARAVTKLVCSRYTLNEFFERSRIQGPLLLIPTRLSL